MSLPICQGHFNHMIEEGTIYEFKGCNHACSSWLPERESRLIYCPICGTPHAFVPPSYESDSKRIDYRGGIS